MTLELLEWAEEDYIDFWCICRGLSRISRKDVHMCKAQGSLLWFYLIFLKYLMKMK